MTSGLKILAKIWANKLRQSVGLVIIITALLAALFASQYVGLDSSHSVNQYFDNREPSNVEVAVVGRELSNTERSAIIANSESHFETHSFYISIKHQADDDFRVGAGHVIVVDKNFPFESRLAQDTIIKIKEGDALVAPLFARELGIKKGETFVLGDQEYSYTGELVGLSQGYSSDQISNPNILILGSPQVNISLAQIAPNFVDKIHIRINDKFTIWQEKLASSIRATDVSVVEKRVVDIERFSQLKSTQSLAGIAIALSLITACLLLNAMPVMPSASVSWLSHEHPIWNVTIGLIVAIYTVGAGVIWLENYNDATLILHAFQASLIQISAIILIVAIETYLKPSKRLLWLAWMVQFVCLGVIYWTHSLIQVETKFAFIAVVVIFLILIIAAIYRRIPLIIQNMFDGSLWRVAIAALLCTIGMGVLIEGTQQFSDKSIREPQLVLFDMGQTAAKSLPELLREDGLEAPAIEKLIVAQISAINGNDIVSDRSNTRPNSLSMTTRDRALPGSKVIAGSWWSVFSTETYVAMNEVISNRLGLKIGDKISFFTQGDEAVAELKVIFRKDIRFDNPFTDVFASSPMLEHVQSSNYVVITAPAKKWDTIISKVSTRLPEVKAMSNLSEIWVQDNLDTQLNGFLKKYEWRMTAVLAFLSMIIAAMIPRLRLIDDWECKITKIFSNLKLIAPFLIGVVVFYGISMLLVMLLVEVGATGFVRLEAYKLDKNTWVGMGLLTFIIFTFAAIVQYFGSLFLDNAQKDDDFS